MQKPSVGRIVPFVLPEPDYQGHHEHRPAIIVRVWNEEMVQLQVFTDGINDGAHYASGVSWQTSVNHDEAHSPRSWHWPEHAE